MALDETIIKSKRLAAGLSQKQLADLVGVHPPQIFKIETGERALSVEWARRIAPHLNCHPVELLMTSEEIEGFLARHHVDDKVVLRPHPLSLSHHLTELVLNRSEVLKWAVKFDSNDQLYLLAIQDEAMKPSLLPGDVVIMNASKTVYEENGLYVLNVGGQAIVRRLQDNPFSKAIAVLCDNPHFMISHDFNPDREQIIGRVLGCLSAGDMA